MNKTFEHPIVCYRNDGQVVAGIHGRHGIIAVGDWQGRAYFSFSDTNQSSSKNSFKITPFHHNHSVYDEIQFIDNELGLRLDRAALDKGTSKNNLIKDILARALGLPSAKGEYPDDYAEFCGFWSAAETAEFEAAQSDNSRVDLKDWQ